MLASRIQQELTARSESQLQIVITTSIGVVAATQVGYSLHRLLVCADAALYQAKTDRGNCVRVWSGPLEPETGDRKAVTVASNSVYLA